MTIRSEDAVDNMISAEIESESVTDAIASARMTVVSVDDENAINNQPGAPDDGEAPCDSPDDVPPSTGPGADEPESGDDK